MTETKNAPGGQQNEETSGGKTPRGHDNKWTLVAFVLATALFFFFVHLGDAGRGRAAGVACMAIIVTIRSRWGLRKRVWFWATMVILMVAHLPLIMGIHWPDDTMPAVSLLPFGMLDWAIMYGCIKLVEKVTKRG